MTRYQPLWQQAGSYAASQDRSLMSAIWPQNGVVGGVVSAVANTLTVSVAPGTAAVALQAGQGSALCRWDAAEVPPALASGPATGNTRIDVIYLQVRDNAIDAGANNDFVFLVAQGVPATSNPAIPAIPANALALANVVVPALAANLNAATITDQRTLLALGAGASTPLGAGAAFSVLSDTSGEMWIAKGGVFGGAWRRAKDTLYAKAPQGAVTLSGSTPIPMGAATTDPYGCFSAAGFTCPMAGQYLALMNLQVTGLGAGSGPIYAVQKNGADTVTNVLFNASGTAQNYSLVVSDIVPAVAGDVIRMRVGNTSGTVSAGGGFLQVRYVGTG
jgi:hypothetical protein